MLFIKNNFCLKIIAAEGEQKASKALSEAVKRKFNLLTKLI